MSAAALAAPDLTGAIQTKQSGMFIIGVKDLKGVSEAKDSGPFGILAKTALAMAQTTTSIDASGQLTIRGGIDSDGTSNATIDAAAMTLSRTVPAEAMKQVPGYTPVQNFNMGLPAGVTLASAGTIAASGDVYTVVQVTRSDGSYMLAAKSSEELARMAAFKGEEPARSTSGPVWIRFVMNKEATAKMFENAVSRDLVTELSLVPRPNSFRMQISSNVRELISDLMVKNDSPQPVPTLTAGGNPLAALLTCNIAWLPVDLTENSLKMPDEAKKQFHDAIQSAEESTGLTWPELLAILRGRITIGFSGTVKTMLGELPGIFVHASGITGNAADKLKVKIQELLASADNKNFKQVTAGEWKGFSTPQGLPVEAQIVFGPNGMLISNGPVDSLGQPAVLSAPLKEAGINHNFALLLDGPALKPLLALARNYTAALDGKDGNGTTAATLDQIDKVLAVIQSISLVCDSSDAILLDVYPVPGVIEGMLGIIPAASK